MRIRSWKKFVSIFALLLLLIVVILFVNLLSTNEKIPLSEEDISRLIDDYYNTEQENSTLNISDSCHYFLESFNLPVSALLIDEAVLNRILNENCESLEKSSIHMEVGVLDEDLDRLRNHKNLIIYSFSNSSEKDFFEFSTYPKRIIPKRFSIVKVGNVMIPLQIERFFEYWKRSKFIKCVNKTMVRNESEPLLEPKFAITALSLLRDIIVDHGMYPFLIEGTLLGWYRECNLIPHTHDMDLAIFYKDYNPELLESLKSSELFEVDRVLGDIEDSYEFTVDIYDVYGARTDIFLMYRRNTTDEKYDFIGGTDDKNDKVLKIMFMFPTYDPWCAADLLGHIFWVSCSPDILLPLEYGQNWDQDHETEHFHWYRSQKNSVIVV